MTPSDNPCYCGSGLTFDNCCGQYISGSKSAETAEKLMRSRYCAYVIEDENYLLDTWHPDTRPKTANAHDPSITWTELQVLETTDGGMSDEAGTVKFTAFMEQNGTRGSLRELSRFKRGEDGRWYYYDGTEPNEPPVKSNKVGRNEPCPCGSGKKYKKCCGR